VRDGRGTLRPVPRSLPPRRTSLLRGGRLHKRWRYVGVFSPELMLCAADVRIGPLPVRFFAVAQPDRPIVTATPMSPRAVRLYDGRVAVRTRGVEVDVELAEDGGVATWHDEHRVWTRKQAGVPARLAATVRGRRHALDCLAVVDDSAGYHPRRTRWFWSAGVGTSEAGNRLAWNLVDGINDEPSGSERAVWVDGVAHEPGPVEFASDLTRVEFAEGGALSFDAWAAREADTNLLLLRSRYRAPFGTFAGVLPGAGELAEGYGVMEWHDALW
jgi:hypothetical protein